MAVPEGGRPQNATGQQGQRHDDQPARALLTVGSLFSGIGGLDLGLQRAGLHTVWFVERDPLCRAILRRHWPGIPIYEDITTINWDALPKVDVLVGGFPCQDISNAGHRRGITGAHSSLWQHFAAAIGALRPRYVIIENVAALLTRGLDTVVRDLNQLGYRILGRIIAASDLGAPHRRERLYLIAYPSTLGRQSSLRAHLHHALRRHKAWNATAHRPRWQTTPSQLIRVLRHRLWQTHPAGIRRVALRLSDRMDRKRLAVLGNAAIPAIAQAIGTAIKKHERTSQ